MITCTNRPHSDGKLCGNYPVVAYISRSLLSPFELCESCAEQFKKEGGAVHYYKAVKPTRMTNDEIDAIGKTLGGNIHKLAKEALDTRKRLDTLREKLSPYSDDDYIKVILERYTSYSGDFL